MCDVTASQWRSRGFAGLRRNEIESKTDDDAKMSSTWADETANRNGRPGQLRGPMGFGCRSVESAEESERERRRRRGDDLGLRTLFAGKMMTARDRSCSP